MAMEVCAHCGSRILFGAAFLEGKPYCPGHDKLVLAQRELARNLAAAKAAYDSALAQLRQLPSEPSRREAALSAGRVYAAWTRHAQGQTGVTLFDEVALSNDLEAASAAAAAPVSASGVAPSLESRLARLQDLRSKGLINEQEFATKREQILSEL